MSDADRLALAARSDQRAFAELVDTHRHWMVRVVAQTTGRFVTESDDEWSIALMAFHEAVQSYDESKGSFRTLAGVVIKRRVLDYLRSESRHRDEIAVSPSAFEGEMEEDGPTVTEVQVQKQVAHASMDADERDLSERTRAEIEEMQAILKEYGFSFFDLAESSPKTEKTKKSCRQAVRCLIASVLLMAKMRLSHLLPIRELSDLSGVVKKILDRHRRYIIAAAEILDGDFPILAGYMDYIRKG